GKEEPGRLETPTAAWAEARKAREQGRQRAREERVGERSAGHDCRASARGSGPSGQAHWTREEPPGAHHMRVQGPARRDNGPSSTIRSAGVAMKQDCHRRLRKTLIYCLTLCRI